ncbi:MAG: shikimate dehydrogenase [Rhodospirillaceae bacterium]|nr:shikimate dehydrogenase [Rhodospirillaceae bacterium]
MTGTEARPPITGATGVLVLLGRPVEHALTPVIHNAALAAAGLDVVYIALSPRPETLEMTLRGLIAGGCRGLCITIPFKTQIVPMLDALAPSSEATGAVNTVVVGEDGRLTGYNTDVDGVLACIDALPGSGREHGVIIGAGGAGRSAVAALEQAGVRRCQVLNRSLDKAEKIAADFAKSPMQVEAAVLDDQGLERALSEADLLVNTTSVGMYPHGDATPVPARFLHSGLGVADAVYRPNPTRLCREAAEAGAATAPGTHWIVGQGVVAYRLWLGAEPDTAVMHKALADYFAKSDARSGNN